MTLELSLSHVPHRGDNFGINIFDYRYNNLESKEDNQAGLYLLYLLLYYHSPY